MKFYKFSTFFCQNIYIFMHKRIWVWIEHIELDGGHKRWCLNGIYQFCYAENIVVGLGRLFGCGFLGGTRGFEWFRLETIALVHLLHVVPPALLTFVQIVQAILEVVVFFSVHVQETRLLLLLHAGSVRGRGRGARSSPGFLGLFIWRLGLASGSWGRRRGAARRGGSSAMPRRFLGATAAARVFFVMSTMGRGGPGACPLRFGRFSVPTRRLTWRGYHRAGRSWRRALMTHINLSFSLNSVYVQIKIKVYNDLLVNCICWQNYAHISLKHAHYGELKCIILVFFFSYKQNIIIFWHFGLTWLNFSS